MKIQFLGANRQVTGSRYLLETGGLRILVDCGLFQERAYLERNWEKSPVPPASIDALLLTHAHLDHCGLIPRLVGEGFRGPIYCTAATKDLAEIIMSDSARIQVEDAEFKKKRHAKAGYTPPRPVAPLYTPAEVEKTMPLFRTVPYNDSLKLNDAVSVVYHDAGHILGSAILEIRAREGDETRSIIFSGDLGQMGKPIIRDPEMVAGADCVVMESTYGDRDHKDAGPADDQLAEAIGFAVQRGGKVIIPTFAVERAQELAYHIGGLVRAGRIPQMPVYLDSPMAVDVTEVFRKHKRYMDDDAQALVDAGKPVMMFDGLELVRSVEGSKAINATKGTCIIMSTSGMCTAGRIKHHLKNNISDENSVVVFVGFQAFGTLGREIAEGRNPVRIHGQSCQVRAKITTIHGFSAHADRGDLLNWVDHFKVPPKRMFLTHGEQSAAMSLAKEIESREGYRVFVPEYLSTYDLD